MDSELLVNCLIIVAARICDVSLSTLRTVNVIHGNRGKAFFFGFLEVLVWVNVVSRVISQLSIPVYGVSYALGFALGNYIGLSIEERIGWGEQVARIFTRKREMEEQLRAKGYGVTVFEGRGLDGPVMELFIQCPRRKMSKLLNLAKELDSSCYYLVGNVSYTSSRHQSK